MYKVLIKTTFSSWKELQTVYSLQFTVYGLQFTPNLFLVSCLDVRCPAGRSVMARSSSTLDLSMAWHPQRAASSPSSTSSTARLSTRATTMMMDTGLCMAPRYWQTPPSPGQTTAASGSSRCPPSPPSPPSGRSSRHHGWGSKTERSIDAITRTQERFLCKDVVDCGYIHTI